MYPNLRGRPLANAVAADLTRFQRRIWRHAQHLIDPPNEIAGTPAALLFEALRLYRAPSFSTMRNVLAG